LLIGPSELAAQLGSTLPTLLPLTLIPPAVKSTTPILIAADPAARDSAWFGVYRDGKLHSGAVGHAHNGVLLANLTTSTPRRRERLRSILDVRRTVASTRWMDYEIPAHFQLVATAERCACGGYDPISQECWRCSRKRIDAYLTTRTLKGRTAITVQVGAIRARENTRQGEPSAAVRARVVAARDRQVERLRGHPSSYTVNADLRHEDLRACCPLDAASKSLADAAVRQLNLSASNYLTMIRLARTIADLAGADQIGPAHLAESIQYVPHSAV
jgi:magnesium chelatase family protein